MAHSDLPFPETVFVSHYDSSSAEIPSLNACLTEMEAVDDKELTAVAEYKLVRVRKLIRKIEEFPF